MLRSLPMNSVKRGLKRRLLPRKDEVAVNFASDSATQEKRDFEKRLSLGTDKKACRPVFLLAAV